MSNEEAQAAVCLVCGIFLLSAGALFAVFSFKSFFIFLCPLSIYRQKQGIIVGMVEEQIRGKRIWYPVVELMDGAKGRFQLTLQDGRQIWKQTIGQPMTILIRRNRNDNAYALDGSKWLAFALIWLFSAAALVVLAVLFFF